MTCLESEKNVTRKVSENPTGRLEEKKLKSKRPGLDKGNFLDTKKIYSHLRQNPGFSILWTNLCKVNLKLDFNF